MAFDALRPMPIDQLALRSKIAERSGEHIYFPNGQIYPGKNLRKVKPRPQIFVGWTTRFFLYLPKTPADHKTTDQAKEAEYKELERSELKVYFHRTYDWWLGIRTERGHFFLPNKRDTEDKESVPEDKIHVVKEDSYFSVALRAKSKSHFAVLYNEVELRTMDAEEIPGWDWFIQFKTGIQTLLSWHTTDELNNTQNNWTNYLTMEYMWWPAGTVATITVFVEKVPSKTTITLKNGFREADFSSSNVKNNTTLRFSVSLSAQKAYVTSDFYANKVVGLSVSSSDGPHYIAPSFPQGLLIRKIETVVPSFPAAPA